MRNLTLLFVLLFISCATEQNKKNDLAKRNLKGNVKSVKGHSFDAVEKFGETVKEKKKAGRDYGYTFNEEGNVLEKSYYNSGGKLKDKYRYDASGNKIEEKDYMDNVLVNMTTYKYKYDQEGNWIGRISFDKDDKPSEITEREIIYY